MCLWSFRREWNHTRGCAGGKLMINNHYACYYGNRSVYLIENTTALWYNSPIWFHWKHGVTIQSLTLSRLKFDFELLKIHGENCDSLKHANKLWLNKWLINDCNCQVYSQHDIALCGDSIQLLFCLWHDPVRHEIEFNIDWYMEFKICESTDYRYFFATEHLYHFFHIIWL